jgi:hypothetical protein
MGIEPTFSAWEADVLPLNYTRAGWDSIASPLAVNAQSDNIGRMILSALVRYHEF